MEARVRIALGRLIENTQVIDSTYRKNRQKRKNSESVYKSVQNPGVKCGGKNEGRTSAGNRGEDSSKLREDQRASAPATSNIA
jgi:hypothetical protein